MYKTTERPTLELINYTGDIDFLIKCCLFSKRENINKIIINFCDTKTLSCIDKVENCIKKYKDIQFFYRTKLSDESLSLCAYIKNMIIVTSDLKVVSIDNNLSNYIEYLVEPNSSIPKVLFSLNNVIWNITFNMNYWMNFDSQINNILDYSSEVEVMFSNILIPRQMILDHPCNVYMCSGKTCHSGHGNIPRYLKVFSNGDIYPYSLRNEEYYIGNIHSNIDNILKTYKNSVEHNNFIELNKVVYSRIIDKCCYSLIPWFDVCEECSL